MNFYFKSLDSKAVRLAHRTYNMKLSCCCDSRSYFLRRTAYWQTIKPVWVTSLPTAGTHDPFQRVEFMQAPKLYLLKRD